MSFGTEVASIFVKVRTDTSSVRPEAESAARQAGAAAGQSFAGAFAGAIGSIGSEIASTFTAAARIGVGAMATVGTAAVTAGASYNILGQRVLAATEGILGSRDAAEQLVGEMVALGRTSPFPRQALLEGAQLLAGYRVEASLIPPIMSAIQEGVAGIGGGPAEIARVTEIFGTIQSQGRITGRELMRLGQMGFDAASMIGDSMGLAASEVRDQITAGALDAETALVALADGMEAVYGGTVESLFRTFSATRDGVLAAMRDIGSALVEPFIGFQEGGAVTEALDATRAGLRSLVDVGTDGSAELAGALAPLAPLLDDIAERVVSTGERFGGWLSGLDSGPLDSVIGQLEGLGPLAAGAAAAMATAFAGSLPIIGGLFAGLNPIVVGVGALIAASPPLRSAMSDAFSTISDAVAPLLPQIADIARQMQDTFEEVGPRIIGALGDVIAELAPVLVRLGQAWADAFGEVAPMLADIAEGLASAIDLAVDFANALGSIPGVPAGLQAWFDHLSPLAWMRRTAGAWDMLGDSITGVGRAVGFVGDEAVAAVTNVDSFTQAGERYAAQAEAMWNASMLAAGGSSTYTATAQDELAVILGLGDAYTAARGPLEGFSDDMVAAVEKISIEFGTMAGGVAHSLIAASLSVDSSVFSMDAALSTLQASFAEVERRADELQGRVDSAMTSGASSILSFTEQGRTSLGSFTEELATSLANLTEWQQNLVTIAERGSGEFALQMAELGPGFAGVVAELATTTDEDFAAVMSLMLGYTETGQRDMATEFGKVDPAFQKILAGLGGLTRTEMDILVITARAEGYRVGAALAEGVAMGIRGFGRSVSNAAAAVTGDALAAERRRNRISSPSRLWADQLGAPLAQGIAAGMLSEADRVANAAAMIVEGAADSATASAGRVAQVIPGIFVIADQYVRDLATSAAITTDDLGGTLNDMAARLRDFASGVARAFQSATSLVGEFGRSAEVTAADIMQFFTDQVEAARNWSENMAELAASGIDHGLLEELARAGPEAAPLVAALLEAVADGNVDVINQAQSDLATILADTIAIIGAEIAPAWDEGQALGEAIADGLEAGIAGRSDAIRNQIRSLVAGLVNVVNTELGIASPSRVFMSIGRDVVRGLELGLAPLDGVVHRLEGVGERLGVGYPDLSSSIVPPISMLPASRPPDDEVAASIRQAGAGFGDEAERAWRSRMLDLLEQMPRETEAALTASLRAAGGLR